MTDLKNDAQRVYDKNFPNSNFKSKGLKADKLVEPVLTTSRMGKKIPSDEGFFATAGDHEPAREARRSAALALAPVERQRLVQLARAGKRRQAAPKTLAIRLSTRRPSPTISTPQSDSVRIRRPAPCLSEIAASGS